MGVRPTSCIHRPAPFKETTTCYVSIIKAEALSGVLDRLFIWGGGLFISTLIDIFITCILKHFSTCIAECPSLWSTAPPLLIPETLVTATNNVLFPAHQADFL